MPSGIVPVVVGVLVAPLRVRARDQRHQVGAHDLGGREAVHGRGAGPLDLRRRVRDDLPVGRRGDREGVAGLEVGLVEAGEHAAWRRPSRTGSRGRRRRRPGRRSGAGPRRCSCTGRWRRPRARSRRPGRAARCRRPRGSPTRRAAVPLSVAEETSAPTKSIQLSAPGSRQANRTVVVVAKVVSPGAPAPSVRSISTAYAVTSSRAARRSASTRVRLGGAMPCPTPLLVDSSADPTTCAPDGWRGFRNRRPTGTG